MRDENGSVYQHAVTFEIFADIATGHYEEAYQTFVNMLQPIRRILIPDVLPNRTAQEITIAVLLTKDLVKTSSLGLLETPLGFFMQVMMK